MHNILLIEQKDRITPTLHREKLQGQSTVQRLFTSILAKVTDGIFLSLNCRLHSKMT